MYGQTDNPKYGKALAESLGGDAYGMKSHVLATLTTGNNTTADKETTNRLFRAHMDNIGKLVEEGKLIGAGPLQKKDKNYRDIFILNVRTVEEAKALLETDPAVKGKLLDAEVYGCYGSAALPEYLKVRERIERTRNTKRLNLDKSS